MYNPNDKELWCGHLLKKKNKQKKNIECPLSSMTAATQEEAIKFHPSKHRAIREGITLFTQIVTPKKLNKIC